MTLSEGQRRIMQIVKNRNTKKYCVYSTAALGIGYIAYKAYQRNLYHNTIRYLDSIRASLNKYKSAVDKGGDIVQTILTDLYEYVLQDESDVPPSIQRLAKLAQSKEVTTATSSTVRAAIDGFLGKEGQQEGSSTNGVSALDKVLEALLSDRGQNLVSVALSMAAKNVVSSYIDAQSHDNNGQERGQGGIDALFLFLSHPRGQALAVRCIAACANSAMKAYMEKAMDINYYDQLFTTMVKPNHVDMVKECITISIQAAVSAYMGCGDMINEGAPESETVEEALKTKDACISTIVETNNNIRCATDSQWNDDDVDSPCSALRPPLSVGTPPLPTNDADFDPTFMPNSANHNVTNHNHAGLRQRRKGRQDMHISPRNDSLLRALGTEWIHVSQDEKSRAAIVAVVGCVTKEAVGAVAHTVADRIQMMGFLSVLILGILVSLVAQSMLRAFGLL